MRNFINKTFLLSGIALLFSPFLFSMNALAFSTVNIQRASVDSTGQQYTSSSNDSSISGNGRYVAFVKGNDVYLRDLLNHTTSLVTVTTDGLSANGSSRMPSISSNGRYVAFSSYATNLPGGYRPGQEEVFVRDTVNNTTQLVSVSPDSTPALNASYPQISSDGSSVVYQGTIPAMQGGSFNTEIYEVNVGTLSTSLVSIGYDGSFPNADGGYQPSVSSNGQYVAFQSYASNLVSNDTDGNYDIFVRDTVAGTTTMASVDNSGSGTQGTSKSSSAAAISDNGRYVVFNTDGDNFTGNSQQGIFVRDMVAGTTSWASLDNNGNHITGTFYYPSVSPDGRYVAFTSNLALVPGDTNNHWDMYVIDLQASTASLASVGVSGAQSNGDTDLAVNGERRQLSNVGSVSYFSQSSNLVSNDTNNQTDVFVSNFIDTTAPTGTFTNGNNLHINKGDNIKGTASDSQSGVGSVIVTVNSQTFSSLNGDISLSCTTGNLSCNWNITNPANLPTGNNTYTLTVTDAVGNTFSTTGSFNVH